jgi:hypothetical protein
MSAETRRGSRRLIEAWKDRERHLIRDEHVEELSGLLENSPASVDDVIVVGGSEATGLGFSMTYDGDDIPLCGIDLYRLLDLLRRLGTPSDGPVIIINGRPAIERLTVLATLGVLPANAWDAVIPKYRAEFAGITR